MRGRKPKPTAIRELQRNPGHRAINRDEPKLPKLTAAPPAPEFLGEIARAKWADVAELLVSAGVLTGGDLHNLECLCQAYQRWRDAEAHVKKHGAVVGSKRSGFKKNPAVTVLNEAQKQVRDFGALLGLDPSSRSRLHIPGVKPPSKENPFAVLPGGKSA